MLMPIPMKWLLLKLKHMMVLFGIGGEDQLTFPAKE
jgi:hypothetical protein